MITINIASLIGTPNAIIQKFGLTVFEEARGAIDHGEIVNLDFKDLSNTTTGFFHASIGNLFKSYGEQYDKLIKISGLEKRSDWVEKYQEAIDLVQHPKRAEEIDIAIAKLFE